MSALAGAIDVFEGRAAHRGCGGAVYESGPPRHVRCPRCPAQWAYLAVAYMSGAELDATFVLHPEHEPVALVWLDDPVTRMRFTKLLPVSEAAGKERVRP